MATKPTIKIMSYWTSPHCICLIYCFTSFVFFWLFFPRNLSHEIQTAPSPTLVQKCCSWVSLGLSMVSAMCQSNHFILETRLFNTLWGFGIEVYFFMIEKAQSFTVTPVGVFFSCLNIFPIVTIQTAPSKVRWRFSQLDLS